MILTYFSGKFRCLSTGNVTVCVCLQVDTPLYLWKMSCISTRPKWLYKVPIRWVWSRKFTSCPWTFVTWRTDLRCNMDMFWYDWFLSCRNFRWRQSCQINNLLFSVKLALWWSGPHSRNDPLAIGSDTNLWSWSTDRIPQTPITIGSSDRENTKPNSSLLPIESRHKSFTGKFRIEITWSWLNKKVRLMISIHDVTMGGVATSFMSADTKASWPVQCTHTVFAHDTTRFGHAIFNRYVHVINVIESIQIVDTRQAMFQ